MKAAGLMIEFFLMCVISLLISCESGGSPSDGDSVTVIQPPRAPSDLAAIETGGGVISLAWTDNSSDETGFIIERKTGTTGSFEVIAAEASDKNTFTDSNATVSGACYYYRVKSENSGGSSSYTNEASPLPKSPAGLALSTAVNGEIELAWNDNSYYETGFRIERKSGTGDFTLLTIRGKDATYYKDTGLTEGTLYTYRVCATSSIGNSSYSNESAKYPDLTPGAPGSLVLSVAVLSQIRLDWSDNSANETGFIIERKNGSSGTWSQVTTVAANIKTFTDTGLNSSTRYYYRVKAYNGTGDSTWSEEQSCYSVPVPPVPASLNITVPSDGSITLSWSDASSYETGFKVERSTNGTAWNQVAVTAANATAYSETGLNSSTLYYYRIRAAGLNGDSGYSDQKSSYAQTIPLSVSGLSVTVTDYWESIGSSGTDYNYIVKYTVSWNDNAFNESGYYVRAYDVSDGFYFWSTQYDPALPAGTTSTEKSTTYPVCTPDESFTDECKEISFQVYPYNYAGTGAVADLHKTIPVQPPWMFFDSYTPATLTITLRILDMSAYETQYIIERSTNKVTWVQAGVVDTPLGSKGIYYFNNVLPAKGTYYYRARGKTSTGYSIYTYIVNVSI